LPGSDVNDFRSVMGSCGEQGRNRQTRGLDPHEDGDVVGGAVGKFTLEYRRAKGVLGCEVVEEAR